jgi:cytochrome c
VNPCRFKQPAHGKLGGGNRAALLARGEKLWSDSSLSSNGAACATCHQGGAQFQASFAQPYPHPVAMVKQMSGVPAVNAAEMVQFCMLQPMQAEPLPWGSVELAALTAYVENLQQSHAANPCAMKKNPCAGANPCNPCARGNPCAGRR